MDDTIRAKLNEWLGPDYDDETKREIQELLDKGDEKELTDRFYKDLEFGTGGLRGIIGAGTNRMNIYTVRKATQGLANYIIKKNGREKGVVIGRDSRLFSDRFAWESASVLLANGIKVYFFWDIHPTPLVSYAVRKLGAMAGIMITASHNPRQYNGYKVFWSDGGQVVPPEDHEIIEEVSKISSISMVKHILPEMIRDHELLEIIDVKIDPEYLNEVKNLSIHPEINESSDIKICYSPLHGTGYKLIPQSLKNFGFKNVYIVEEQSKIDGNFPTAPFPNPEIPQAMEVGVKYAEKIGADLLIVSDPDADRIGVMIRKQNGKYQQLNGNQVGAILLYYILNELKSSSNLPPNPMVVTTIVTTRLILEIGIDFGVKVDEVLTGFKWIAEKIRKYESEGKNFIFGCEESLGYLVGSFVRDKDAIIASSLFCELAAHFKKNGKTIDELLDEIYLKYGYFVESQKSIEMSGREGQEEIKKLMEKLRNNPPDKIGDFKLLRLIDIKNKTGFDFTKNESLSVPELPTSDVLIMEFSKNCRIISRPSGTEPKIKFYFMTNDRISEGENLSALKMRVEKIHTDLKERFIDFLNIKE